MLKEKFRLFRRGTLFILKVLTVIGLTAMFIFTLTHYYPEANFYFKGFVVFALLYAFIYTAFGTFMGCFRIGRQRLRNLSVSHMVTIALTNAIVYLILCLIALKMLTVLPLFLLSMAQVVIAVLFTIITNRIYYILYPPRASLFIRSAGETNEEILDKF
ncbi:hypothetical protein LJC20_06935, partial [Eubacteriales bacterium OttesenSCG-928-M02]|nr:hypothetical protein [Eubacteriales bacterium OttesenSCG-928-M02]